MLFMQWDLTVILLQIITIDLLLGSDNAVVIAMACRQLPQQLRTRAMIIGTAGAIVARLLLLALTLYLLALPWLKIVGALLLLGIGIKLVTHPQSDDKVRSSPGLWQTAVTITLADTIMSLDNVLAVAAAGKGHLLLVMVGVIITIPLIMLGSKLVLMVLNRFPFIVLLGGALIGWIAGEMLVTDPVIIHLFPSLPAPAALIARASGAMLIVLVGWQCNQRGKNR